MAGVLQTREDAKINFQVVETKVLEQEQDMRGMRGIISAIGAEASLASGAASASGGISLRLAQIEKDWRIVA